MEEFRKSEVSIAQDLRSRCIPVPRILLVDDDIVFGKIMMKIAHREQIPLTYYSSVKDIAKLSHFDFDLGIFDYDLGAITGLQLTEFLERYLRTVPIILISQYRHIDPKFWPASVKEFVPKSAGAYGILNYALGLFSRLATEKSEGPTERLN